MIRGKYYLIYLKPKSGISSELIEKKMNLALDWFKFDASNWVVYSNAGITKLTTRYKPLVEQDGRLFICELNTNNRNGWMNKDFWAWLTKKREN